MIDVDAIQETLLEHVEKVNEFQRFRAADIAKDLKSQLESGATTAQIRGTLLAEYPGTANPAELTKKVMVHRYMI